MKDDKEMHQVMTVDQDGSKNFPTIIYGETELKEKLTYHKEKNQLCAVFVDNECVQRGSLSDEKINNVLNWLKINSL